MVKSGSDRSDKYTAKYDPTVIGARATATLTIATTAQVAMQEALAIKNKGVRDILDAAGVMPIMSVGYQAFSGKLGAICRKFALATARSVAELEATKFLGYGLTESVLKSVWGLYAEVLGAAPSPL